MVTKLSPTLIQWKKAIIIDDEVNRYGRKDSLWSRWN